MAVCWLSAGRLCQPTAVIELGQTTNCVTVLCCVVLALADL